MVSSFLRAGAPALGLWAEGEDAGAGLQLSLPPPWAWSGLARPGRLFIITELRARLGAGATHEPGVSLNSLLVSSPHPGPASLVSGRGRGSCRDPWILSGTHLSCPAGAGTIS